MDHFYKYLQAEDSGGFRGAHPVRAPPPAQNLFNFIGFFRKYYLNIG